jgi:ssDNA-binding Zn-finger/Zn-ribbon topoisomerase 1
VEYKVPFGIGKKDNKLYHITQVEKGIKCDCVCPGCGEVLIAKKGDKKEHHFAHRATSCEHAHETAIHYYVKELIEETKVLKIPPHGLMKDETYINIDRVELEKRFDSIVPDVVVYIKGVPLFLEVNVFHAVDDDKLKKIRQLGIDTIELNICDMNVDFYDFDREAVADLVINNARHKTWVYSRKVEKAKLNEVEKIKREHEKQILIAEQTRIKIHLLQDLFKPFEDKNKCTIISPSICECGAVMTVHYVRMEFYLGNHDTIEHICKHCKTRKIIGQFEHEYLFGKGYNIIEKCSICGQDMLVRYSEKTNSFFLGCSNYPSCKAAKKVIALNNILDITRENFEEEAKKLLWEKIKLE